jgi:hypothetical protein
MTLSDRLAAAARVRDAVATGQPEPAAPVAPPTPADLGIEVTIVLPPEGPVAAVPIDLAAAPGSLCPTCARPGQLSLVDLPRQTTDWQCIACGTLWRSRSTVPVPMRTSLLPPMRG